MREAPSANCLLTPNPTSTFWKLCFLYPWEFMAIIKATQETPVTPIVVDGAEGGTIAKSEDRARKP